VANEPETSGNLKDITREIEVIHSDEVESRGVYDDLDQEILQVLAHALETELGERRKENLSWRIQMYSLSISR